MRLRVKKWSNLLTWVIWCFLSKMLTKIKSGDNKTIRSWNLYVLKSFFFCFLGFITSKPDPKHHGCPGIVFLDPGKDHPGSTFCAPDPKIYLPGGPWEKPRISDMIKPQRCSRYPGSDGPPYVLYAGPDPIIPLVRCGLFRPIHPPKCVPTGGGPIGDPPMHPQPDYPTW